MSINAIAKRYAKALVQIGSEAGTVDRFNADLSKFSALLTENRELAQVFGNPAYGIESKTEIMKELVARVQVSPIVSNLLMLLLERGRLYLVIGGVGSSEGLDASTHNLTLRPRDPFENGGGSWRDREHELGEEALGYGTRLDAHRGNGVGHGVAVRAEQDVPHRRHAAEVRILQIAGHRVMDDMVLRRGQHPVGERWKALVDVGMGEGPLEVVPQRHPNQHHRRNPQRVQR